ncbi:MAG: hypothetical protein ABMA02_14160 [Saprospiraceae bacterium]
MRALFILIIALLTTVFFAVGIIYVIARLLGQIAWNPESKAFQRMLGALRARLMPVSVGLVPWDHEMLGLLSLNRANEKRPGWFNPFSSGQITTIYQEPVVAYAAQQAGHASVTVARISSREFVFRKKGRETEVWLNGVPFGLLAGNAFLATGKGSKVLGHLENKEGESQTMLVLANGKSLALNNFERASGPIPRAVTLMQQLDPESETIALAVTLARMFDSQIRRNH